MKSLALITFCCALTAAAQTSVDANSIVIWKVGSPYTGETPDATVPLDLKLRAEKIGHEIRLQTFPAQGFAQIFFDAVEKHQEPDVVAFDNYGILNGATTSLGAFTGIGSSATVRKSLVLVTGSLMDLEGGLGGWQFLLSTSKNHEAARSLALPSPECDTSLSPTTVPAEIQSISQRISRAFLEQSPSLTTYEDSDRLVVGVGRGPIQVSETTACGFWGSASLAFVPLISTYESPKVIGQLPTLLILRKRDTQWRLLVASGDGVSNKMFLEQIPVLSGLFQKPANQSDRPQPAKLLSPPDGEAPVPGAGQRFGNFTWSPSPSKDVVAEIVEFAYNGDARLFLRLRPKQGTTEQISTGTLMMSRSDWSWRVWSITDAGNIAFSQSRSFPH